MELISISILIGLFFTAIALRAYVIYKPEDKPEETKEIELKELKTTEEKDKKGGQNEPLLKLREDATD